MIIYDLELENIELIDWVEFKDTHHDRLEAYDWEQCKKHPSKNNPRLTAWLIEQYSKKKQHILDPMCGIGTTLVEGLKLNRNVYGFDIYANQINWTLANCIKCKTVYPNSSRFKVVWDSAEYIQKYLAHYLMDLVLYSPPYGKQNHKMGDTPGQKAFRAEKRLWSCQDYSMDLEQADKDVSRARGITGFYDKMKPIIEATVNILRIDGHMCIIVQDYIRKGKPVGIVQRIVNMVLAHGNMQAVGFYARKQDKTSFKLIQHKRGNTVIGVEHTLIFKKGRK